jgi:hypothetical protein
MQKKQGVAFVIARCNGTQTHQSAVLPGADMGQDPSGLGLVPACRESCDDDVLSGVNDERNKGGWLQQKRRNNRGRKNSSWHLHTLYFAGVSPVPSQRMIATELKPSEASKATDLAF